MAEIVHLKDVRRVLVGFAPRSRAARVLRQALRDAGFVPHEEHHGERVLDQIERAAWEFVLLFENAEVPVSTPIYDRVAFTAGQRFSGPAIVEQDDTTTVVHPGWSVEVVTGGSIILVKG